MFGRSFERKVFDQAQDLDVVAEKLSACLLPLIIRDLNQAPKEPPSLGQLTAPPAPELEESVAGVDDRDAEAEERPSPEAGDVVLVAEINEKVLSGGSASRTDFHECLLISIRCNPLPTGARDRS